MVRDNGTVTLAEASGHLEGSVYMAPEVELNPQQTFSDTALEKVEYSVALIDLIN